jgi:hypothetical protein
MAQNEDPKAPKPPKPPEPAQPATGKRGTAKIEVHVELDLDDAAVFDLRGEGIKTVTVVSN